MCDIFIRTDKGEYFPGDVVFGAVYLQVSSPVGGEGVAISFSGFEAYSYWTYQSGKPPKFKQEKKDYIECRGIELYSFNGAIPLGQYVFPFKWQLPWNLPGSFLHSGQDNENKWEVDIAYSVEAHISGAEDIKTGQPLIVRQLDCTLLRIKDEPLTYSSNHVIKGFFMNGTFKIFLRLDKILYAYNENAHIDVDFEYVKCKMKIQSISVKLMRKLILKGERRLSLDKVYPMHSNGDPNCVHEEVLPFIVSRSEFKVMENFSLKRGVKNVIIPLCQRQEDFHTSGYPTTCSGAFIECSYWIDVTVEAENRQMFFISAPTIHISQKENDQWHLATIPHWCTNCQVLSSATNMSAVSRQELASEAFTGLPGFMLLEMR